MKLIFGPFFAMALTKILFRGKFGLLKRFSRSKCTLEAVLHSNPNKSIFWLKNSQNAYFLPVFASKSQDLSKSHVF